MSWARHILGKIFDQHHLVKPLECLCISAMNTTPASNDMTAIASERNTEI